MLRFLFFRNNEFIIIVNNCDFIIVLALGIGDWGLGIGDWGLGIGPNPQSPIPNPQSPIYYSENEMSISGIVYFFNI